MNTSTAHPFTCNTCQVAFKSSELQRTHMQNDWHRYNLKRRVASLPPLSSEVFNEKVLQNRATAAATAARASYEKNCELCKKVFYSDNAYANHLSSSKHKANALKSGGRVKGLKDDDEKSLVSSTFSLGEPVERASTVGDAGSEDEADLRDVIDGMDDADLNDRPEPVSRRQARTANGEETGTSTPSANSKIRDRDPLTECLFCSYHDSETLEQALDHMIKVHGLFVPEPNYVADMEGLIKYLNVKVNEEHQCLYCGRLKWSEDGIKTHMRDTNHCKIAYEDEDAQLEIGQFYDFRSTYSDEGSEWSDEDDEDDSSDGGPAQGGGVKLGAKRTTKTGGDDEEAWESDSSASSAPTDEIGRVYEDGNKDEVRKRLDSSKHHSSSSKTRHRSADGFHSHATHGTNAVYYDEVEMHLPSGRTAGHRSLNKIWRQNLRTYPTPAEREQRLLTERERGSDDESEKKDQKPSAAAHERERGRGRGELVVRNQALGVAGLGNEELRAMEKTVKKEQKREARHQNRFQLKVAQQANHQKHFRDPLLQ